MRPTDIYNYLDNLGVQHDEVLRVKGDNSVSSDNTTRYCLRFWGYVQPTDQRKLKTRLHMVKFGDTLEQLYKNIEDTFKLYDI